MCSPPAYPQVNLGEGIFFLVVDADILSRLYLDCLELRAGKQCVAAARGHGDHTAGKDILPYTVDNRPSFAQDNGPDLVPSLVAVVIHPVSGI